MPALRTPSKRLSPSNRSLERGLQILRAFRPGSTVLGNSEIADRARLPRSTVSRLTTTLARAGFLDWDPLAKAYRLAPPVLGLAQSFLRGSSILQVALPRMRRLAESERVNVGLAVPDGDEMIYLDSVRRSRDELFRDLATGSRIPMELTSLGRAYLGSVGARELRYLMAQFRRRHESTWPSIRRDILRSVEDVRRKGYCIATWQAGIAALGAPLVMPGSPTHTLNISTGAKELASPRSQETLARKLLVLVQEIREDLGSGEPGSRHVS